MQTVPSLNITYTEEKGERPALANISVLLCSTDLTLLAAWRAQRNIHTSHMPVSCSHDMRQAQHEQGRV